VRALVALVCCVSLLAGALGQVPAARKLAAAPNEQQFQAIWKGLTQRERNLLGDQDLMRLTLSDRQRTLRDFLKDGKWGDAAGATKVKDARAEAKKILVPPAYRPRELNCPALCRDSGPPPWGVALWPGLFLSFNSS